MLSCQSGMTDCGGSCVDLQSNRAHCGSCGDACAAGEVCSGGACELSCQSGMTDCGGNCVDLDSDRAHCGGCGNACAAGEVCSGGACELSCQAGLTNCSGVCVNLLTDDQNCGSCGHGCGAGETCANGSCDLVCPPGLVECGSTCTDLDFDPQNCGACGHSCGAGQACSGGSCMDLSLVTFSGPQTNISLSGLSGWTVCHTDRYEESSTSLSTILSNCNQEKLMLACRQTGSDNLIVAAYAHRDDVTYDTGTGDTPHNANGVGWYYDDSYSWGFADQGDPIDRNSCDTASSAGQYRLCWHTSGGNLNHGWRCGTNTDLNSSSAYERLVLTAP
jgi:hypothetical protein